MVFDTQWFKKYNKVLTKFARLPFLGELIFNFKKFGHYVDRKKICEITPNSVIEKIEENEFRQHFFGRNEYALRLQSVFYPIWITFHTWDNLTRPIPQLNLGFDTLTVYPDSGDGTTNSDGRIRNTGSDWSTIRNASDGNSVNSSNNYLNAYATLSGETYYLDRVGISFDTSELTSDATISSAVISLAAAGNNYGTITAEFVSFSPASTTAFEIGDFDAFGSTSFAQINSGNWGGVADTYYGYSLNASGIANISKTGFSSFGLRSSFDMTTSEPTGDNSVVFRSSNYGSYKPKLVITYSTNVAYIMTCQTGSYALMGVDSGIIKALKMACQTGNYVLTGININIHKGYVLSCQTASYILIGANINITKALKMVCQTGSYVLTGVNIGMKKAITMICQTGSYILTGNPINILYSGWTWVGKHISTFLSTNKNNSTSTLLSKNTSVYTAPTKNSSTSNLEQSDRHSYDETEITFDSLLVKYDDNFSWSYATKS